MKTLCVSALSPLTPSPMLGITPSARKLDVSDSCIEALTTVLTTLYLCIACS